MSFHDRLKEARIANGLTQKQLAEKLGIAGTTVTGYEKGNSEPSVNTIGKIMEVLHVDANFLWQDEIQELNTDDFSIPEIKMIKKYRNLDHYGKELINLILEKESERCENKPKFLKLVSRGGKYEIKEDNVLEFKDNVNLKPLKKSNELF